MKNREIQRIYMQNLAETYEADIVAPQEEIYRRVNPMLNELAKGDVLLMGSGPLARLEAEVKSLTALDYSESMLRGAAEGGGARVCADAAALPFDRGTFDTVILPFIVHHLAMDDVIETDKAVAKVLSEGTRVLRANGRLIVADLFLGSFLELMLRSVYRPVATLLNQCAKPMMFFYSLSNLTEIMRVERLRVERVMPVALEEPLVLTLLAPRFRIPARYHPAKFFVIECVKTP